MESETGVRNGRAPAWMYAFLACVFVVSFALRLPRMNECIWYDEYCRTHAMLNSAKLAQQLLHDVHNPLYNAFMYAWISVVGDSDWSIRVPSLLVGYASLLLFCSIVRRRAGAWAAWGLAAWGMLTPMHVWYSTEAKNNMFVLASCTLAFWAVDRLLDRPTRGRATGAALALLAAYYTDFVSVLVVLPLLAWPFIAARRNQDSTLRRRAWAIVLAVLAGAAPWAVFKALHVHELWRDYLELFRPKQVIELLGGTFMTGHAFAPLRPERSWVAGGVFVLILPLLMIGGRALWRGGASRVFVFMMVFAIGGMTIASGAVDALMEGRDYYIYQPRNLLCVLYVFGAILWTGVSRVSSAALRTVVSLSIVIMTLAASLMMLTVNRDRYTVDKPRSDWRAVANAIHTDAGGAHVVALSRSPILQLERYSDRIDAATSWGRPVDVEVLATTGRSGAELYYVDDLDWWPAQTEELAAWRREYKVSEIGRVGRMVLYVLKRR